MNIQKYDSHNQIKSQNYDKISNYEMLSQKLT